MIPLVSTEEEIKIMKDLVIYIARKVQNEHKVKINFLVGTMIELPRAAIKADDIAKHAEFLALVLMIQPRQHLVLVEMIVENF